MLHVKNIICIFALWIGWFGHQSTRGKSITPSTSNLIDVTKKIDCMPKKKSLEDVKSSFVNVWGDRFIYDLITYKNYVNMTTKVPVVCKEHGVFEITPSHHVAGIGCRYCQYKVMHEKGLKSNRRKVCGVGFWDVEYSCNIDDDTKKASCAWRRMISRCYDNKNIARRPSYKECSVCEEWLYFSNFKKWFDENYIEGYALDKDILVKGNKVYSPDTCCFVPQEINSLIVNHGKAKRGGLPLGVRKGCGRNTYAAIFSVRNSSVYVGTYNSIENAFNAYKNAKEKYIKDVAQSYYDEGKITKRVYDALMKYKIEITD